MLSRSTSWLVKKSYSSSCSYSSAIIKVGDEVSQIRTFTKQDVQQFCDIIGDTNPVHSNSEVAKSLNFKDILVPGLFLNGMISSLIGNHLPGPGSILVKQFLDFVNPFLRQLDDHFDQNATVYKGGVVFALIGAVYYSFIKVFKKDPLLLFKSPSGKPFREKESLLPKEYTIGPKKLKKTMSDIENNVKNGTWVKLSKLFHRKSAKTDTEQNKLLSSQSDSNSSKDISGAKSNAKPFKKSNISLNKLFRKKPSRPSSKPSSEPSSEPPSKSPSKTPSKTSSKTPSKTSSKTSNKSNELLNKPQEPSQIEKLDKNKKTDNVNSTSYSFSPIQQRDKLYKFFTIQFEN